METAYGPLVYDERTGGMLPEAYVKRRRRMDNLKEKENDAPRDAIDLVTQDKIVIRNLVQYNKAIVSTLVDDYTNDHLFKQNVPSTYSVSTALINNTNMAISAIDRFGAIMTLMPMFDSGIINKKIICRKTYTFYTEDQRKQFIADHENRTDLTMHVLKLLRKVSNTSTGNAPFVYNVDHVILTKDIEMNESIYDVNTDYVFCMSANVKDVFHPNRKINDMELCTIEDEFTNGTANLTAKMGMRICCAQDVPSTRYYYKAFGELMTVSVTPNMPEQTEYPPVLDQEPKILSSYVEVWTNGIPVVSTDFTGQIYAGTTADGKSTELLYRVSLEDAKKKFCLSDSREHVECNGDIDAHAKYESMKQKLSAAELELSALRQKHEHEIKSMQAKNAAELESHERTMREKATLHQQTMAEKTTSHSYSMRHEESKSVSEIVKIVGATIAATLGVVLSLVKLFG